MTDNNKKFIYSAIELAQQSVESHQGGPFGAVVVKDGEIIGRGSNQVTHNNDPTAHAEIEAIRDACQKIESFSLENCSIYCSSEPCPMCLSAIYWARIDQVFFANTYQQASKIGFDDQFIFKELSLPHDEKQLCVIHMTDGSVLKKAEDVFKAWDESQFKQAY